ncbi:MULTISPECIES: S8 family serine peptidase [unclassified Myroides]|uniref:S8 family serine peptidase n=1 Tax=unclassified Myroides TaxID=2642485 RepID=UPI0031016232
MKKITLFAFLAVPLFSLQMRGQDLQTRTKVVQSYDLESSERIVDEISKRGDEEKKKAILVAQERGAKISGVDKEGNYFEVVKVTEEGLLLYRTTLSAGSRVTARVEGLKANNDENSLLEGSDMIFGVLDGMTALTGHEDFAVSKGSSESRVIGKDRVPSIPYADPSRYNHQKSRAHATHVSGIIAAGGFYKSNVKGLAPKSTVYSYNWSSDTKKMGDLAKIGVLVSNHSYGLAFFDDYGNLRDSSLPRYYGVYTDEAYDFDRIANLYPFYLPVVAAGNDGRYTATAYPTARHKRKMDMLSGTAVSKNIVVVASAEQVDSYIGPKSVKISNFSSQGPTDDFRIKPDIAAKGSDVYAPVYENPEVGITEISLKEYTMMSGTSMAAPAVTAVFGLWQEWAIKYSEKKTPFLAATIRALMAHTASEAGPAPGPDHWFGWGLINATAGIQVLEAARNKVTSALVLEETLRQGGKVVKEVEVKRGKIKLVATLAWNDPAYSNYARSLMGYKEENMIENPTLVNDLDIVVKGGGKTYYPWRLKKDFSDLYAERGENNVDNIEKIEIEGLAPGKYEVIITHKNSLAMGQAQDYSLVVTVGEFEDLEKEKPGDKEGEKPGDKEGEKPGDKEGEKPEDKEGEKPGDKEGENPVIESDSFGIWPNPVADQMYINMNSRYIDEVAHVRVFDIDGRMVRDFKGFVGADGKLTVNMASLTVGSYFVEVKTGKFKKKVRIMKR